MKKSSVEHVKNGAMILAFASMCSGPALANNAADVAQTQHVTHCPTAEAKAEAPLVVVTEAENEKLSKGQVILGTQAKPNGRRWVTAKIKINARPHEVWDAVHEERKSDPDLAYSKILEEGKNEHGKTEQTLEQKFQLIPVLGTSVCVLKSTEEQNKRIDYHLISSDRFKAVEGSWILQPEGESTILELGSYIDIGVPAPRTFVEGIAGKKLANRLNNVRKVAESHKIAAQGKGGPN